MKNLVKFLMVMIFTMLATNSEAVCNNLSPFAMNEQLAPGDGTAESIFSDINDLDNFESEAGEFVVPAWIETLTMISPANYPLTTFLTQKSLDNIRGLALAEASSGRHSDVLNKVDGGSAKFNSKYAMKVDNLRDKNIKNYKLNWGQIAVMPMQDVISSVSGSGESRVISVANVAMWRITDLLRIQGATYTTASEDLTGKPLVLYVGAIDTANNQITVYSLDNSSTIPTITDDSKVTRQGNAAAASAVRATSKTPVPESDFNYCQKFITSVVFENYMEMTALFSNYSFSLVTNIALQEFRYGQEFSFMFGVRAKGTNMPQVNGDSETVYTTDGLLSKIDSSIEYGTAGGDLRMTEDDIVDITKAMRVGNNGSDTRFLLAGSDLIANINKGVMSNSTRFVQKEFNTLYGLSFTSLYSFFGTINVAYAPLMDQTEFSAKGWLLDMDFISKSTFLPFRQIETDMVKLRLLDGTAVDMVEACTLVVQNLDCHNLIEPATV